MNTIYLISYYGDISAAYATNKEGIKQLALEWYWMGRGKHPVEVDIDMDNRTVMVYNPADDESISYDIFVYVRL